MNRLLACRVCLAYDTRLSSIMDGQLRELYEKLVEASLDTEDMLPTSVCYICNSLMNKMLQFRDRSQKANQILQQMISSGLELSVSSLDMVVKDQTDTSYTLGISDLIRTTITSAEEKVKVKIEPVKSEIDSDGMSDQSEDLLLPQTVGSPPPLGSFHEVQLMQASSNSFVGQQHFHSTVSIDSMDVKPQFTNLINTTFRSQDVEMLLENSLDYSSLASPATQLSIGGNGNPYNPSMSATPSQERSSNQTATPASSKKKKESKQKIFTGYLLYCKEVRKAIIASNPDCTFGEISRIVGHEWRSLPAATKQIWQEHAKRCNEGTTARLAAEEMGEVQQHAAASAHDPALTGSVRDDCALRLRRSPLTRLEADMENYVKYRLKGGKLMLKKGIVPHEFDCQLPTKKKIYLIPRDDVL